MMQKFPHSRSLLTIGLAMALLAPVWAPRRAGGQDFDRSRMYLALPPLDTSGAGDGATTGAATTASATAAVGAPPSTTATTATAVAGWDLGYAVEPDVTAPPRPSGAPAADADVMLGQRPLMTTVQFHRDLIAWDPAQAILAEWKPMQTQLFTDPPSMIQYAFAIELSNAEVRQELTTVAGRVDEAIHRITQTIPPDDLRTLAGKMRMKRRIVRAINAQLTQGAAREIYFTEFFIQ